MATKAIKINNLKEVKKLFLIRKKNILFRNFFFNEAIKQKKRNIEVGPIQTVTGKPYKEKKTVFLNTFLL